MSKTTTKKKVEKKEAKTEEKEEIVVPESESEPTPEPKPEPKKEVAPTIDELIQLSALGFDSKAEVQLYINTVNKEKKETDRRHEEIAQAEEALELREVHVIKREKAANEQGAKLLELKMQVRRLNGDPSVTDNPTE